MPTNDDVREGGVEESGVSESMAHEAELVVSKCRAGGRLQLEPE